MGSLPSGGRRSFRRGQPVSLEREVGEAVRAGRLVSERFRAGELGKFGRPFARDNSERGILAGFHARIPDAVQTPEFAELTQNSNSMPNSVQPNTV